MLSVHDGQCGMCLHYGENQADQTATLVQIRLAGQAPEALTEQCGHPKHAPLHLKVTAVSGCDGFEPVTKE